MKENAKVKVTLKRKRMNGAYAIVSLRGAIILCFEEGNTPMVFRVGNLLNEKDAQALLDTGMFDVTVQAE